MNTDLIKLNGRKTALKAPLDEIPSLSDLYSNLSCDFDPRQINTEPKYPSDEITVMDIMDINTVEYHNNMR